MPFSPVSKKVSDFSLNSANTAQSDSSTADSIRRQSLTPDFRAFSDHERTSSINFRSTTSFSDYGLFYEGDQDSSTSCTTASSSCSNFLLAKVLVAAQSDDNESNKLYANKAASQPYNGQSIDSLTHSEDQANDRNTITFSKLRRSPFFGLGAVDFELEEEKKEEAEQEKQDDQFSRNRRFLSYLGSTASKTHLTAVCSSDRRRSSMPAIGTPATIMANVGDHKAQKCVIVAKEDNGFGLTIGGDNPFFVQSVKLGSSADRVGVKSGDRILKISGNMLLGLNHMDVVKMIGNSKTYVALTLLSDTQRTENENAQSTVLARPLIRHSIAQMLHQQSTESITVPAYMRSVKSLPPVIREQEYVEKNKEHDQQQKEHIKRLKDALLEEKRIYEELTTIPGGLKLIKNRRTLEQCKKRIASLRQQLAELNASSPADVIKSVEYRKSSDSSLRLSSDGAKSPPAVLRSRTSTGSLEYSEPVVNPFNAEAATGAKHVDAAPFENFEKLRPRIGHLSVFLHYLLSNSDPASLIFYLVSELYRNGAPTKECRIWAYELYSTFLHANAPLRASCSNQLICQEIESILTDENLYKNEEKLKHAFDSSKLKTKDEIEELLADFRSKRALGLGSVFGENLLQGLGDSDLNRERKIADHLLTRHIETYFAGTIDYEQLTDKFQALATSLNTILKMFGVRPENSVHEKLLEKCPLFVSKEEHNNLAFLSKLGKQAIQFKGHQFAFVQVNKPTTCFQCQKLIWGVMPQIFSCSGCHMLIHKTCLSQLEDVCYGSDRFAPSRKIPATDVSVAVQLFSSAAKKNADTSEKSKTNESPNTSGSSRTEPITKSHEHHKSTRVKSPKSAPTKARGDIGGGSSGEKMAVSTCSSGRVIDLQKKSIANNVGRSKSLQQPKQKRRRSSLSIKCLGYNSECETCDEKTKQNLSEESDQESDERSLSSESSIGTGNETSAVAHQQRTSSPTTMMTIVVDETNLALTTSDSDLEIENDIPRLEDVLHWDIVKLLKPKEKKRQEVINELFHTERTHVRNLKIVKKMFFEPLSASQPHDFVKLLFANLDQVLETHVKINSAMKAITRRNKLVGDIGDLMLYFFDGSLGQRFCEVASTFCKNQQHALEVLKAKRKKSQKLDQFLQEAECCAICRKLQLKDMLPMEMQRLTKYPMLFENVAKYTPDPSDELSKLKRCAEAAKEIAVKANAAKREAENSRRTHDLQKRLDTKEFDRSSLAGGKILKNLDLRRHRLVYDGSLVWRLSRNKAVDLHVILLEDFLVLLTKNSDGKKLSLKYHSFSIGTGKEDVKYTHCPILQLNSLIAKSVATDTRAFFVVKTSSHGPQIYEFVSQTSSEKKKWIKFLSEQIDISKNKEPSAQQDASNNQQTSVLQLKNENIVVSKVPSMDVKTLKLTDTEPTISDEENQESGVERAEIKSQPKLINPSEVMIQKPTILEKAQPVLTPLETLKRNDEVIINCLTEKLNILTDMFQYSTIDELQGLPEALLQHGRDNKEAKELVLAAIVQTNRILEAINSGMKTDQEFDVSAQSYKTKLSGLSELPAVSCATLTRIAAPLIKHLTALLHSLQKMDDDLKRMQNELYRCKGLIVSNFASAGGGEPNSRSPRKGILVNEKFRTSPNRAVSMALPNSAITDVDDYARRGHCLQTKEPSVDTVPLSQICHPFLADKKSTSSTSAADDAEQVVETSLLIAKHSGAGMCGTATAVDCASSPAVARKISTTISTTAAGRQRSPSNNRTSAVASFVTSAADALARPVGETLVASKILRASTTSPTRTCSSIGSPARTVDYESESGTESRSSTPDPGKSFPVDISAQCQVRNAQSVKSQACVLEPRRSVYSRTRSESNILAPGAAMSTTTESRGDTDDGNDNEKLRLLDR